MVQLGLVADPARRIALSDYAGKVVLLNLWGSWCPPCRSEAHTLKAISARGKAEGVEVLGLNVRDNRESAAARANGQLIELGPREWTVMEYLLINAPKPASKDKLLQAMTGWDKEITPNIEEWEETTFPDAIVRRMGELGFLGCRCRRSTAGRAATTSPTWCWPRRWAAPGAAGC